MNNFLSNVFTSVIATLFASIFLYLVNRFFNHYKRKRELKNFLHNLKNECLDNTKGRGNSKNKFEINLLKLATNNSAIRKKYPQLYQKFLYLQKLAIAANCDSLNIHKKKPGHVQNLFKEVSSEIQNLI